MEEQTVPSVDPTSTPLQVVPPVASAPVDSTSVASAPAAPAPTASQPVQAKSHRLAYILLGIGVLVIIGLVAALLLRPNESVTDQVSPTDDPLIAEQTQPMPEPTPISGGVLQTILAENCVGTGQADEYSHKLYTAPLTAMPFTLSQEWQNKYGSVTEVSCLGSESEIVDASFADTTYNADPDTFRAELRVGPTDKNGINTTKLAIYHRNSQSAYQIASPFESMYLFSAPTVMTSCPYKEPYFYGRCFQDVDPGFNLEVNTRGGAGLSTLGIYFLLSKGKTNTDQSISARAYAEVDIEVTQYPTLVEVFEKYAKPEMSQFASGPAILTYTIDDNIYDEVSIQPFFDEFKNALIQLPVYQNARDTINETMDAFEFKE